MMLSLSVMMMVSTVTVISLGWFHDDDLSIFDTDISDCCPVKKVGGQTYTLSQYNETSTKLHQCNNGCIYKDSDGRDTCFTEGKQSVKCEATIRKVEEIEECNGTVVLDPKHQHALEPSHVPWGPGSVIPYLMDSDNLLEDDKLLFKEAMEYIESLSCIRFEKRTNQSHYLEFDRACVYTARDDPPVIMESCDRCLCFHGSYVDSLRGMADGRVRLVTGAKLTPGNWESRGHITHELLHVLGHHHTQNRPDRHLYIRVNLTNILDPNQYKKCSLCVTHDTPYDCMSIMHYRWNGLSKSPDLAAMEPIEEGTCDLRSRNRYMAWSDVDLLNINYNCDTVYSGEEGVIRSHDTYPNESYSSMYWNRWYLSVEPGYSIAIEWEDFQLEDPRNGAQCIYDYVAVIDGSGQALPGNNGRLSCGSEPPINVTSITNKITVEIRTDGSGNYKGFLLRWRKIRVNPTTVASSLVSSPVSPTPSLPPPLGGEVSSPRFPMHYPSNLAHTWVIEVKQGRRVKIWWEGVMIEKSSGCHYDWVEMREPIPRNPILMEKTCGRVLPPTLVSHGPRVEVVFSSDYSVQHPGFKLHWEETLDPPTRNLLLSPNYPRNYPDHQHTVTHLSAPQGKKIRIVFKQFSVEEHQYCNYDWVTVRDQRAKVDLVHRLCGSISPAPFTSLSNSVKVTFHSDFSVGRQGFKMEWTVVDDSY